MIVILSDLSILRGVPSHVRSDNGREFAATAVEDWITGLGAKTAYIEPSRLWEDGYVENFNGELGDEPLNAEVSNTLAEAKVLIEGRRRHHNTVRPHSFLRYRPPALEVLLTPRRPSPARHLPSDSGPTILMRNRQIRPDLFYGGRSARVSILAAR